MEPAFILQKSPPVGIPEDFSVATRISHGPIKKNENRSSQRYEMYEGKMPL